jgi:Domain of unknown function (DUF4381)
VIDPLELPLRDIHLPPPISWWPLAPGWWILFGSILIVVLVGGLTWWWWHRGRLRRAARRRWRAIATAFAMHRDPHRLARELSALCRQLLIQCSTDPTVSSAVGETWLKLLDRYSTQHFFTTGPGRVLIQAPYDPKSVIEGDALLIGVATLITRLPRPANAS